MAIKNQHYHLTMPTMLQQQIDVLTAFFIIKYKVVHILIGIYIYICVCACVCAYI